MREGGDQEYEPEGGGLERILEKPDRVPAADDPLTVEAVRVGGDAVAQHPLDELVHPQIGVIHVDVDDATVRYGEFRRFIAKGNIDQGSA